MLKMLQAYKDGATTDQVFQRVLNTDVKAFDKKFDDYLRARFAGVLPSITKEPPEITRAMSVDDLEQAAKEAPNDFGVQLLAGDGIARAQSDVDKAIPLLEKARDDVPRIRRRRQPVRPARRRISEEGRQAKEIEVLTKLDVADRDEREGARATLADLLEKLGDARARRTRSIARCSSIRSTWRCISSSPGSQRCGR